jgi:hypothetical protein
MSRTWIVIAIAQLALVGAATATEPVVYPAKGQSTEQQERDQFECHEWATKETGVDPVALAEQKLSTTPAAEKKPGPGGAAGGAGLGAARGAMDGDAAGGAARGFGIGRMISVMKAKRQLREQQSASASQGSAVHDQLDTYDRAYAACLTGRGYTVE